HLSHSDHSGRRDGSRWRHSGRSFRASGGCGAAMPASSMLLFHATAVLATVALTERGVIHGSVGQLAAFGFVVAAALFAGDLTLSHSAGHRLFPLAAPIGGTLLILSCLPFAVAAAFPPRRK